MTCHPLRRAASCLLALLLLAPGDAPAQAPATARDAAELRVVGTSFVVALPGGQTLRSPDLVGTILTMAVQGRLHEVRIDAVERDPMDRTPTGAPDDTVWLHSFSMRLPDGSWRPVCGPDPEGRRTGFPLAGHFDPAARLRPAGPGVFEIACTDSGQGKCVRFGYHPWRQTPQGEPLLPYYNACVLMIRGDYAGANQPKTRNGMMIDVNDRLGMQPPDFDPALEFEAGWTEEGAVCVAHPRVKENATLAQLEAEIPRLRGRTGAVCTEEFALRHGALIVNRSRR